MQKFHFPNTLVDYPQKSILYTPLPKVMMMMKSNLYVFCIYRSTVASFCTTFGMQQEFLVIHT